MRKLTTLFVAIIVLSCNAQEPRPMYSVEYVDSIKADYEQRIYTLQTVLETYDNSEISVIADTFNFEVVDDRIKIEVNKLGHDCHVEIIDGDKRIYAYYVDYERIVNLSE